MTEPDGHEDHLRAHKEVHAALVKQMIHEADIWKFGKERRFYQRHLRLAYVVIGVLLLALIFLTG